MIRMLLRHAAFALFLAAAVSCVPAQDIDIDDPEPLDVDAEVTLQGGRERALCSWSGMPREVSVIRLDFGADVGRYDVATKYKSGSKYLYDLPEGGLEAGVTFLAEDGRTADGGRLQVQVYGKSYETGLKARTVMEKTLSGARAEIVLDDAFDKSTGYIGEKFSFRDVYGERVDTMVTSGNEAFFYNVGGTITHRGAYKPFADVEDIFFSKADTIKNQVLVNPRSYNMVVNGYKGIWFDLGQAKSSYGSKYSGGLGTYTMKHIPMSIYAKAVDRTFFVYGGTPSADRKYLLCMVGCYDHKTGMLQKPRIVMDKNGVDDPHDDPTIQIDRDGYIWIFVSGRGNKRVGRRYRSVNPYDITAFDFINESIMAYPQVMYNKDKGFFLFFTRYDGTRQLFYQTSPDGRKWSDYKQLASIKEGSESNSGHYQISNICGDKLCTAFNRHINGNVDTRTNIYYLQSTDWGQTWTTADGTPVKTPVTERYSNCLIRDYQVTTETHNCYIKDLNFDTQGNPVILYLTSKNYLTGPDGGTRQWHVIRWDGKEWIETLLTTSTHCYDSGSLWIEGDEWTVIAPTDAGPQYWGTGGEVVMWKSNDMGATWRRVRTMTSHSTYNQTYMRRPWYCSNGFYSFWADGDPDNFTPSHLYFCNKEGDVFRMPYDLSGEWTAPEKMTY